MPERYSDSYKEQIFQLWYTNDRLSSTRLMDMLPTDKHGRKPSASTVIEMWKREGDWPSRADLLDAKAIEISDNHLIQQKADMLVAQAVRGELLQKKGIEYIDEHGFDSSASAVTAIIRGAELERTSRGIGELIMRMSKMNDEDLKQEILKRVQRIGEANTIDAVVEEQKIEDTEDDDTENKADNEADMIG